ncbi:MAG TPA: hypothetical protein VD837_08625 [Terriglobales bacterium]|nr:hypothetical protein [Terriglobales bacterium]
MFDTYLIPEGTMVTAKGDGPAVEISAAQNRTFLLLLNITEVVEQESLDLTLWGASDAQNWGTKPLASYPQKFYTGEYPLLLDLAGEPELKFLRAHWELNRWGRGPETPMFKLSLRVTEVAPEVLREANTSR